MKVLLCFLAMTSSLTAESPEDRARHASVYAAARQYERAEDIYRALLNDKLQPWQRQTVQFNLATLLVDQQLWEAATKAFEEIAIDANSSPLLRRRYYYNFAVALMGLVKSQMYLPNMDDPTFTDKVRHLEKKLKLATQALDRAQAAECDLSKLEGRDTCATQTDITTGRQRAKQLFAAMAQLQRLNRFEDLSLDAQISRLIVLLQENGQALEPMWKIVQVELSSEPMNLRLTFFNRALQAYQDQHFSVAIQWLRGILDLEIGDEIEALLQMRIRGATEENVQALLQEKLKRVPVTNTDLLALIGNSLTDPIRALELYRIATGRFGALAASLLAASSDDMVHAMNAVSQYSALKATSEQLQALQDLKDAPDRSKVEAFGLSWDLNGFLKERFGILYENYLLAVAHRQLPGDQLQSFGDQLDQLKRFIELPEVAKIASASGSVLTAALANALNDQSWGVKALQAQQLGVGHLFFSEVAYWLGVAARRGLEELPQEPTQLLSQVVAEEQHAMQVVSAIMEFSEEERQASSPFAVPLHETMRLAQQQPTVWAAPFVGAVLARQREAFSGKNGGNPCQRSPWNEVMPLYFLGESAADRATDNLAQATTSLSSVLSEQKVAYRKWLKALEILQDEKTKAAQRQATAESTTKPQSVSTPGLQMPSNAIDDILRQLQQMDRDDTIPQTGKQSVQSGGVKPW